MVSSGIGENYHGDKGKAYADWQVSNHADLGHIVARKFQPYINSDSSVLDFGAGSGSNLATIACRDKIAVEPNPYSAQVIASRGIRVQSTLSKVPDNSVDVVISHHALEHCLRPFDELVQMRQKLTTNGRLVLIVPIDDWRNQRSFDRNDIHHHLYTWSPLLIGNLVQEAGFEVLEAKVIHFVWPPKVHLASKYLPQALFETLGKIWSHVIRIREIRLVAQPIAAP